MRLLDLAAILVSEGFLLLFRELPVVRIIGQLDPVNLAILDAEKAARLPVEAWRGQVALVENAQAAELL